MTFMFPISFTASDLARALGRNLTWARKFLAELTRAGLVRKSEKTGKFSFIFANWPRPGRPEE